MSSKIVPVLLLTGYLGSGKTTLLNRILNNTHGIRFAVIVNDIGEVNIDAELIAKGGVVGGKDSQQSDLVALENGCICCSLQTDLIEQISELANCGRFDYIVIEASGICEPAPIAQTINSIPHMEERLTRNATPVLDNIVTVVDALRLRDEFGCGQALQEKHGDDDIERLVIEQVEFCNTIILNKISEVSPEEAQQVRHVLHTLQPHARIIECNYCDVPLNELLDTHEFNFGRTASSAAWIEGIEKPLEECEHHHHEHEHGHDCHCGHCHDHHHEHGHTGHYGIHTFVYYRRRGFDLNRFDDFIARHWPASVIRCKGIVYFKHNTDMSYLFEQAGRQKKLSEAGLWYATAPEEELQRLMQTEPGLARDWDERYGDRMIKLVFIGRDMDEHHIREELDKC